MVLLNQLLLLQLRPYITSHNQRPTSSTEARMTTINCHCSPFDPITRPHTRALVIVDAAAHPFPPVVQATPRFHPTEPVYPEIHTL